MTRNLFAAFVMLISTQALADLSPPPPPDYGDCVVEKQKKSPTDECQECNNIYQDGCEKQLKDKGLTRACQIKPVNASEWREVWCKAPAAPKKEEPARTVTETTRQGGCAVDPAAGGSWFLVAAAALFLRRRKS